MPTGYRIIIIHVELNKFVLISGKKLRFSVRKNVSLTKKKGKSDLYKFCSGSKLLNHPEFYAYVTKYYINFFIRIILLEREAHFYSKI